MNNKILAVLLVSYSLPAVSAVWAQGGFDVQTVGDGQVREGDCHMGYCSWSKIIRNTIIYKSNAEAEAEVETALRGGVSYHEDDYPQGTLPSASIKWNKRPHTVNVFCSRQNPQIIIGGQIDELDFRALPGVLWSSGNLYFSVCHNYHGGFVKGAERFAY